MLLQRATILWAIAAIVLPASAAHAEEAVPEAPSSAIESSRPGPAPEPAVQFESVVFDARPSGLIYRLDEQGGAGRTEDLRFDFAQFPASAAGTRFLPAAGAPRTGWSFSGRAGPFRWLAPISGEGETKLRFGGRVPGQPRTPGLGHFNLSVHYDFE
jgi:hypothetical protein